MGCVGWLVGAGQLPVAVQNVHNASFSLPTMAGLSLDYSRTPGSLRSRLARIASSPSPNHLFFLVDSILGVASARTKHSFSKLRRAPLASVAGFSFYCSRFPSFRSWLHDFGGSRLILIPPPAVALSRRRLSPPERLPLQCAGSVWELHAPNHKCY